MSKEKRYRLLKDLPDCKAGVIYKQGEYPQQDDYICYDNMRKWSVSYGKEYVENNPEWFEQIIERPPLGIMPEWRWRELRLQKLQEAIGRCETVPTEWLDEKYNHQTWLDHREQSKQKKEERIEVIEIGLDGFTNCKFRTQYVIPENKLLLIKQAIERVLNNEGIELPKDFVDTSHGLMYIDKDGNKITVFENQKIYTEKEKTEAEEKAFNAAREWRDKTSVAFGEPFVKYPTFSDYKKQNQ